MSKLKITKYQEESKNSFWQGEDTIRLAINIPNIEIRKSFNHDGDQFYRVSFDDSGAMADVGHPKMPFKTIKILLPYEYDLKSVNVKKYNNIPVTGNYKIEPSQEQFPIGSREIPTFQFDNDFYESAVIFPNKDYTIEGVYELRGYRILILNIYPVYYIPNTGRISYYKDVDIEVNVCITNNSNSLLRGFTKDQQLVNEIVDNPEIINSYVDKSNNMKLMNPKLDLSPGSYDYVIITNNALKNSGSTYTFQDLALSKNASGIDTRIITTEYIYANYPGDDEQEQIRNFIIDAYQTWGIEYILLGGDGDAVFEGGESGDDIIPSRGFYAMAYGEIDYNITSDLYYAALDRDWNDDEDMYWGEPGEDDLFAEVYIGRAPVDSESELSNFVYKTLAHEAETHNYLSKALMVGEDLGWSVWGSDYKDEIKDGANTYGYTTAGFPNSYIVDTLYDRDLNPERWNKSVLIPILNDGVHIVNHLGHCDVEYSMKMINEDADSLTNTHYFFAYSQGCYNGAFDNKGPWGMTHANDSIVEHFVTSEHGAFAFVGNSRFGWGDNYGTNGASQYYDRQFFDAMFSEGIDEIGRANQDSKEDNIGYISQEAMRWCYYQLNLLGDPCATLPPQPNDYEPQLTEGSVAPMTGDQTTLFTFEVVYTDADNNPPIYVNVMINETEFPMQKEIDLDEDYTNGCVYQAEIYLQPDEYHYTFICEDYKFLNYTETEVGLIVNEKLNENNSTLANGFVSPSTGLVNLTEFELSVNYTDLDNDAPEYIQATVDSTVYDMVQQDPFDTNFMDGVIFEYKIILEDIGVHSFYFNCSDGLNLAYDVIHSGPNVEKCQLFDGMYITYNFGQATQSILTNITYSYDANTKFQATWDVFPYSGYWKVDALSREMTEAGGTINFGNYYHTPFWIFTNVTLGDNVSIAVDGMGDHNFTISDELIYLLPGFGEIEIWVLEDIDEPSVAWYEKSTGILLNGTFFYYSGMYNYTFEFIDTNVPFSYVGNYFEPMLTDGKVNPNIGDQMTMLNFSVIYTDYDNNYPISINVVVNNTVYPMNKVDDLDSNYTDGCEYEFITYLQPGDYEYYFECADWLYTNSTEVYNDLTISALINYNAPSLTDADLNPGIGYANATLFTYSINYSDVENNAPEFMYVIINDVSYEMYKQDILDNYYIDGCVYIYETQFEQVGTYNYLFNCSDGLFFDSDGPYVGPEVSECQLFDGLYIDHIFSISGTYIDSHTEYSYQSGEIFNVAWTIGGSSLYEWEENVETRIMDNPTTMLPFGEGYHTPFWIKNDVSLESNVLIAVIGDGDHTFRVAGNTTYIITGFGIVEVWVLEDLAEPLTRAYYEKSTGILLNATFFYGGGSASYEFTFVESNAKFSYSHNTSPTLTLGTVTPKIGYETTVFLFSIIYTDLDNDAPTSISVLINSIPHTMVKLTPSDDDYTDGCVYIYTTTLAVSASNYTYEFRTDNAYSSVIATPLYQDLKVSSPSTTSEGIPGYDLFIFLGIIGMLSLVILIKRRKT